MEIKSENVTIRTNAHIVDGKVVFPYQEQEHPVDLMKLEPAGTENFCFVIYDKAENIIARIGLRYDSYPFEFRYEDREKNSIMYIEEILKAWLNWVFKETDTEKVYTIAVPGNVEETFVLENFTRIKNEKRKSWWYALSLEDWAKTK